MRLFALDGRAPRLPPGFAFVAPGAVVVGDVQLGEEASVWFNAVLRGDNDAIVVGPRANIQDGAVIHVDPGFPVRIGENCTIGHRAIVHGCTIDDSTLVGMGATILNGARVGRNCLIGAGTLVTENAEIPDGSLVIGAPGRVRRMLDDAEIQRLEASAETYVRNARRFAAGLASA